MSEVPIHVLRVAFHAMKHCGRVSPTTSEDVQDYRVRQLTATMLCTEGVPPDLVKQLIPKFCIGHPERCLLTFAMSKRSLPS